MWRRHDTELVVRIAEPVKFNADEVGHSLKQNSEKKRSQFCYIFEEACSDRIDGG